MRTICPSCETSVALPPSFDGLVQCSCGTRYDGFAHPARPMPKMSQEAAVVIISEPWQGGRTLNDPPYYVQQEPRWTTRYRNAFWGGVFLITATLGYTVGNWRVLNEHLTPTVGRGVQSTQIKSTVEQKNDPNKVTFSEIEFNSMGRGNYFLRTVLTNTSGTTYDWPLIKVTFVADGRDVSEKVIAPLEYLASEIAAGRTPSPSIAPNKSTPIWMHFSIEENVSSADSYRVSAQYPKRSSP